MQGVPAERLGELNISLWKQAERPGFLRTRGFRADNFVLTD